MWEQGEESKAAEHLVKSVKLNPENGVAFRYIGDYCARVSVDSQRAIKCYQRAVALNPEDFHAGDGLCNLLDAVGKDSLQIAVCKEASNASPRAFWAFRRLGFLQVHQKKWSEAVHSLQHAIRGYPTCADLWEALGLAYQRSGMFTAAIKSYERAAELEDSRIFALIESGNVSLMLGSFRKGIEYFRHALKISHLNVAAVHGLASSLLGLAKECATSGAFGWATSLLEEASGLAVTITSLAGNMSCIWKLHGDIQLRYSKCFPWMDSGWSSETDEQILVKSLVSWKRRCSLAALSACHSYQRALHLAPWEANLYNDVAVALDLSSSFKESQEGDMKSWLPSEKMCIGGLLLDCGNEEFWVALGCLSHDSALKQHALIRGLQLNVTLAIAWAHLGKFYRQAGESQLGQLSFDRARSIDPSLALPWAGMSADANVRDLNPDEAYDCCLQAVQILPLAEFQIGLAMLALHSSHLLSSEVLRSIQQSLQRAPFYPESHNLYGLICEARSEYQNAIASFKLARLAIASSSGKLDQFSLKDVSINLVRVLCKAGNASDAVKECEVLKKEGILNLEGLQIYAICQWQLGKNDMALSAVRSIAAGILSMEPRLAACSASLIIRLIYYISGQESAIKSIIKMPKELFQGQENCFIVSAIHALDHSNRLESVISRNFQSLVSDEGTSLMHCLLALGKLVKNASNHCLGVQNAVHHLRKALHVFPDNCSIRNLIGFLMLSGKEWNNFHLARRCCNIEFDDCKREHIIKSTTEIVAAGSVACFIPWLRNEKFYTSCKTQLHYGNEPIQQLQRFLHQEPWNYKARYLLILNYLQKARSERFPHLRCSVLKRLTDVALSNWVFIRQDPTSEYEKFQLLLCAAEVCLQCQNHIDCIGHAISASNLNLPDFCIFHAHLLLCRAFAVEDNIVSLAKEYRRCLELKTESVVGLICLKLIGSLYELQADAPILDLTSQNCLKDMKSTWNMWIAMDNLVQGLIAIRRKNLLGAEELFADACALVGDQFCLFFCHGVICMKLAKQQCESRFLYLSIRSLKKAREMGDRPLPIASLLLAQAEASLGSMDKWEKHLHDEWFSWPPEARPAEIYFQLHLLSEQKKGKLNLSYDLDSFPTPSRWILQAIHLYPSCLRYWRVLLNLSRRHK